MNIYIILFIIIILSVCSSNKYEHFTNKEEFDIVIPVGLNDLDFIPIQLKYTTKNVIGYRNIYLLVCGDKCNDKLNGIEKTFKNVYIINENIFPFNKNDIGNGGRSGWYLQQLLKLYAGFVIPNILKRYLVIDSDTCFLKPTHFIENDIPLYNYGDEFHQPYFTHLQKLHPSLYKKFTYSGICHHMMFESYYIKQLFELIEKTNPNLQFWQIFINAIDKSQFDHSGASEYELYINYMLINYPDKIKIRKLNWANGSIYDDNGEKKFFFLDYISHHWYLRN